MFAFIVKFVKQTGYAGVLLLMFGENIFPPLPSELIMPLAGFNAARGSLSLIGVLAAGVAGSLLGALFWYYVGRLVGGERLKRWTARHGRWLTLSPGDIEQASGWFERHGAKAVLFGRLIPAVRTLISVPAGVARMPLGPFLLFSMLGTTVWTALLAGAGYLLQSQYRQVSAYVGIVSNIAVGLLALWYVYRVVTYAPSR